MTNLTLPIQIDPNSAPDATLHVTASGLPVRIYSVNGGGEYPIHGAVFEDGVWDLRSWQADGAYGHAYLDSAYNLRDRAPVKRGVWVAWLENPDGFSFLRPYETEHEALNDPHEDAAPLALHYLKEGDGLDTPADPPLWVDWAMLPHWAKWAAVSATGVGRYFAERPERGDGTWMTGSKSGTLAAHFYRLAPGFDWRETLIQRPEDV